MVGPLEAAGWPQVVAEAHALGVALAARGWTVVTAESCTGGLIAAALTEVGGSSAWFERGVVTYANAAKCELLGVQAATLAAHGAVSEAVAIEMAAGALARSPADIALSVTGIAGPGGAVPGKPVGTVCFGWAHRAAAPLAQTRRFDGDRSQVRLAATRWALRGALQLLRTGF